MFDMVGIRDELGENEVSEKLLPPILGIYGILMQELKEGEVSYTMCSGQVDIPPPPPP